MLRLPFRFLFIIFIFYGQEIQIYASSCSTYLIGETPSTFACGSHGLFDAASLNIPSPSKQLSLSFTIQPSSFCITATSYIFLTLTIIPPETSTRKKIMMVSFQTSGTRLVTSTEETTGIRTLNSRALTGFLDEPITIYMSVDLAAKTFNGGFIILAGLYTPISATALDYHPDWVFDSSTLLSVGADENGGTNSIGCIVQNMKVIYAIPERNGEMLLTNHVKLIADYKLNEGKGNSLKNSQGTLASASLSLSTSPIWSPDQGLKFNSNPNQYIQIPGFDSPGHDFSVLNSIAFAFYIKIDQTPTTEGKILSYSTSPSNEVFALTILPTMRLKIYIGVASAQMSGVLVTGQWISVYASYAITRNYGISTLFLNGLYRTFTSTYAWPNSTTLSTADTIKIGGGFTGELRRMQVYSPGAYVIVTGARVCNPSVRSAEIGYSDPPICVQAKCSSSSGYYSSLGSCEPCPKTCATCTDAGTCQTCTAGNYFLSSSCIPCPQATYLDSPTTCAACLTHCASCDNALTCSSCETGYGLYGDTCMICPAATYLSNEGICKEVSQTLQEALKNSQLLNSGATQAANIISKGKAISLSAAVSGKIFSQIKYLNISYSGELQVALITWLPSFVSLGLTPDMPGSMLKKIPEHCVPYVFDKYDVPSSFLINFWENLGVLIFVTFIWLLLKGLERLIDQQKKFQTASILRKGRVLVQNFLITVLYGVYGDLVMFSLVEYRTLSFGWNLSLLSFFISVGLLIAMLGSFLYQIKLLQTYQKLKKQNSADPKLLEQFTKKNEGSQIFWKDFKDYSLAPQFFLIFLSGRDLLFSLILATLFKHPLTQTLLILILNCLMMAYLLIKKPFESKFDFGQQLFFEFIGLIVNFGVLINAILDTGKYETIGARNNLGKLIIVCNMIFNFVTAAFMLFFVAQILVDFYKAQQQKRAKRLEPLKVLQRNQKQHINKKPSFDNNNNSEIISFQQESFDLDSLQPATQFQRPRKIRRNPRPHNQIRRELA